MSIKLAGRTARILVVATVVGISAWAQSFGGKILGNVADSSGGAVPTAVVSISNDATAWERKVLTDSHGLYVASELPVGLYTVRISAAGFNIVERLGVKVDVGGETRADAILSTKTLEQSVQVNAEAPAIQLDSSALAELIGNRQVDALPLNGRDFRRLAFLAPGAAPRSPRGSLGSFTVNGQREKSNIYLIDGVDNNDSFRNQPSFNQGGTASAQATILPVDALAEFSVQTQGSAEYGRNSGAILNAVLKSGTNQFHGTAYEFLRHDKLNARNFFETLPGANKSAFKNSNFGGTVGGPIKRDRTFFFLAYEGERGRPNSALAVPVPGEIAIAAARNANRAADRAENPLGTTLLGLFPHENNPGTGGNYVYSVPKPSPYSDNFLIKVDQHVGNRINLSGRYVFGNGNQTFPLNSGQGSELPAYQTVVPTRVQLAGLNVSQVLTERLINETRLSFNRFTQLFTPLDAAFDPASIGLITGAQGGLPTIVVNGFESLGSPTNLPRWRVSQAYQLVDALVWTRGAHTFQDRSGLSPGRWCRSYNDQVLPRTNQLQQSRGPAGRYARRALPPASRAGRPGATHSPTMSARMCKTIGRRPGA